MKRRNFVYCTLGTAGLAALGFGKARSLRGELSKVTRSGQALGTQVHLTVYAESNSRGEQAMDAAFEALDRVESLMSLYRSDSQLCQLNRTGVLEHPSAELVEVLQLAADLSQQTQGAFDITVQPLWALHSSHAKRGSVPSPAEIEAACQRIGWQQVVLEPAGIQLNGGAQITLNGIAQGYAADTALAALAQHGIHHAILDTGEVGTLGHNIERDHWTVGIKHPRESGMLGITQLDGRCLATSGDYATTFGAGSHHLFDPATGMSAMTCASVSVIAPTAMQADALSTACFVLGVERGMRLIEATKNTDALFVSRDGSITRSANFPLEQT